MKYSHPKRGWIDDDGKLLEPQPNKVHPGKRKTKEEIKASRRNRTGRAEHIYEPAGATPDVGNSGASAEDLKGQELRAYNRAVTKFEINRNREAFTELEASAYEKVHGPAK